MNHNQTVTHKISFKGLKADQSFGSTSCHQDKENYLSFQNLKRENNSQKIFRNVKRNDKVEQIRKAPMNQIITYSKKSMKNLCGEHYKIHPESGSIVINSKKPEKKENLKVEEVFHRQQEIIRGYIENYNNTFNEILEMLTDMQIKDLMKLNVLLENNEKIYKSQSLQGRIPVFETVSQYQIGKLTQFSHYLEKIISNSIDLHSTIDSKLTKRIQISQNSSSLSPRLSIKQKSQEFKDISESNNLPDTPESVRSQLSGINSKIKADRNATIGMFDRINICQSVEEGLTPIGVSLKVNQIKLHRYGRNSEQ